MEIISIEDQIKLLLEEKNYVELLTLSGELIATNIKNSTIAGYVLRSRAYQGLKNYIKALKYIEKYIKEMPNNSSAYMFKCIILIKMKKFDEVEKLTNEVLKKDSKNAFFMSLKIDMLKDIF